jgi:hypothetical protein
MYRPGAHNPGRCHCLCGRWQVGVPCSW